MLNPDDYIISRKRKKYRFAKFTNSPLCFEFDEWEQQRVEVVEIGAGTGLFSVEIAANNPHKQVVALDVKGDRLQKGAYEAQARGLKNIRFVRARADQITELFTAKSVETIWLTFADPFPKKRSSGRRLSHATFLRLYETVLAPTGMLLLKHDNPTFFTWSLEQVVRHGWRIVELSFDLHESDLPSLYKIKTTYETRWLDEGRKTYFMKAIRPAGQPGQ